MLTEAPLNPRKNREKAAQILCKIYQNTHLIYLVETFNVPSLFMSIQAVLALYASGRTTGIVLDSGDGVTHAVPVVEGFSIPNAIKRIDVAGRDITEHLQFLLRKSGNLFYTSAEKEIVRTLKEKTCFIALNPAKEEKEVAAGNAKEIDYSLPDGNVIKVKFISDILLPFFPLKARRRKIQST